MHPHAAGVQVPEKPCCERFVKEFQVCAGREDCLPTELGSRASTEDVIQVLNISMAQRAARSGGHPPFTPFGVGEKFSFNGKPEKGPYPLNTRPFPDPFPYDVAIIPSIRLIRSVGRANTECSIGIETPRTSVWYVMSSGELGLGDL